MGAEPSENEIVDAFRRQADACRRMGSPLYGRLLESAADSLAAGGPLAEVVDAYPDDPFMTALPLRVMGAVHRLVLAGAEPGLARHYPSAGGMPEWPACGDAFLDVVARRSPELRIATRRPVQTNEVGRAAVVLGGLLHLAHRIGTPLALREVGTSAGLNLLLDRYRFALVVGTWGDPGSPVMIPCEWYGEPPPLDAPLTIADRAGCDIHPLQVTDPDDVLRLSSFVWADHLERFGRIRAAVDMARRDPPRVDGAGALEWLPDQLADRPPGVATVVLHTVVWQYLDEGEQQAIAALMDEMGNAADPSSPLAWLRMEPGERRHELRLQVWPDGNDLLLGLAQAHGARVRWLPA